MSNLSVARAKVRGYKESYLKFDLADISGKSQFLLCGEVLIAPSFMVPATRLEFFDTKKQKLESQNMNHPNKVRF